jgi:hypothetical protein
MKLRRLLLGLGLLGGSGAMLGCSGALDVPTGDGGGLPAAPDAGAIFNAQPDKYPQPSAAECLRTDLGPVPPAGEACQATPEACPPSEGFSCFGNPLANTVRPALKVCAYCGEVALGFSSGCASDIRVRLGLAGPPLDAAEACIRQALLGKRWECAPAEGWVSISIDSCTLL